MADSSFKQSNKDLKLRDLSDGTFAQSVQVENTIETSGTVTIENASFEVTGTVSVEKNVLTSISHTSASIISVSSTTVLNANSNRSYVVITNPNSNPIFVGLGQQADSEKGIYLPEDTAYEMSSAYNNLFKGDISAISPAEDATILITEGE